MSLNARLIKHILVLSLMCMINATANAQESGEAQDLQQDRSISFTAESTLTASPDSLDGKTTLTLYSREPIYQVEVFARAQADKRTIAASDYWEPGSSAELNIHLPSEHKLPGNYHMMVEIAFRDQNGSHQSLAMAMEYLVEHGSGTGESLRDNESDPAPVVVTLQVDRINWQVPEKGVSDLNLVVTTEPSWVLSEPLTPSDTHIQLKETGIRVPIPDWTYQQIARLEWVQGERHHSRLISWQINTDADASRLSSKNPVSSGAKLRGISPLWVMTILFAVGIGIFSWRATAPGKAAKTGLNRQELAGGLLLLALTVFSVAHANPALWLTKTWPTGGDTASQVFYAQIFMEWFPKGKISGWLPESFGGFPAFTFYFPFPFSLAAVLQFIVGQQVAFKLVSMVPAFLLPAGTYVLAYSWGWRIPMRLMAAAGATAFILASATSIWGGNVLAQLSGEFAYSWGLLFAVLFWAALAQALQKGGRWWLLAAVVEVLVALSHGYGLLAAGFGAFLYLLVSNNTWRDLRIILQIHLLAFLIIGFWLIPLLENLPWTIPNDASMSVDNWQIIWPKAFWPLMLGWLPLGWILLRRSGEKRLGFLVLSSICLLGILGFLGGGRFGLADLRFFPFAQWAFSVASAAAFGWLIQKWFRRLAMPLVVVVLIALGVFWQPMLGTMGDWSAWNLSGYEGKAAWPHYLATAKTNAGPLHGPRVVFEHDPANSDLGSTRTLEALPMFGSRPALEGLYMESAITGPFIYQLQAEISQRPSSPLSRYPSSARSIEDAVGHLNELYTDRLILRSREKKTLFGADPRFELVAQHGPLNTYQFTELDTQLVELVTTPLIERHREDWLGHAFGRYLVDFPYQERHVYLAENDQIPESKVWTEPVQTHIEVKEFSRERFVFETNRPGQPHLIRMTYHPRWSSTGGESVYLTEPSFMLIYPKSSRVELVYGWSWGNWLGIVFSLAGIALLAWGLRHGLALPAHPEQPDTAVQRRRFLGFSAIVALLVLMFWWSDPELAYHRGHDLLGQQKWLGAAGDFDKAYEGRKTTASRSEALFWAARALDLGGQKQEAATRYAKLRADYPQSFWYPESVFRLIEIRIQSGELESNTNILETPHVESKMDSIEALYAELVENVPDNQWTQQATDLLDTQPN